MAIYRLKADIISRARGQSIIACAAYRAGDKLYDERYGEVYDYTRKQDVVHNEILLPDGAPAWMGDRQKLWNGVEVTEKRKDSQLAREVQLALPRELTLAQNIQLTREFVKDRFVSCGMVADIGIHVPKASDGELQPHAHVLLTMREIKEDGFGLKVRGWNEKCELEIWREEWGNYVNKYLALNGHDIRVDHRSLKEQGIDLIPQKKIGPTGFFHRMAAYQDHLENARLNGERLLENPEIVLDVLTNQQSTFTHHDIARIVNRYTADSEQFLAVYEKVKISPELVYLGTDDKHRERFTTKEMLQLESRMIEHAVNLNGTHSHDLTERMNDSIVKKHDLSSEQTSVLDYVTSTGDLKNIIGYAGTGKSRLLGAAKELWEESGYHVLGATLSGIAAENLEASSGIDSRTIASRFHYWNRGEELLTSKDILVIDEAGMIGSRQMVAILQEAQSHGAKVILVGDPEQLQAIGAGAAFRAITEHTACIELTEIWRQKEDWQKEATVQLATQKTADAIFQYELNDHIHQYETQAEAKQALVDAWNDARISEIDKTQMMLAYTRKDVAELNELARSLRQSLGKLGEDHLIMTEKGDRLFAAGDRIYFLKNDRELGVKNGTLGTIINIENNAMTVDLDKRDVEDSQTLTFKTDEYNHLDYGYAATIHKGQGLTVDRSYVLASEYFDRHTTYVAMTRHCDSAELFWSREIFPQYEDMVVTLSRERGKETTLDYLPAQEFADHRGIDFDDAWPTFESYPVGLNQDDDINLFSQTQEKKDSSLFEIDNFSDLFMGEDEIENDSIKAPHQLEKSDDKEIDF